MRIAQLFDEYGFVTLRGHDRRFAIVLSVPKVAGVLKQLDSDPIFGKFKETANHVFYNVKTALPPNIDRIVPDVASYTYSTNRKHNEIVIYCASIAARLINVFEKIRDQLLALHQAVKDDEFLSGNILLHLPSTKAAQMLLEGYRALKRQTGLEVPMSFDMPLENIYETVKYAVKEVLGKPSVPEAAFEKFYQAVKDEVGEKEARQWFDDNYFSAINEIPSILAVRFLKERRVFYGDQSDDRNAAVGY